MPSVILADTQRVAKLIYRFEVKGKDAHSILESVFLFMFMDKPGTHSLFELIEPVNDLFWYHLPMVLRTSNSVIRYKDYLSTLRRRHRKRSVSKLVAQMEEVISMAKRLRKDMSNSSVTYFSYETPWNKSSIIFLDSLNELIGQYYQEGDFSIYPAPSLLNADRVTSLSDRIEAVTKMPDVAKFPNLIATAEKLLHFVEDISH